MMSVKLKGAVPLRERRWDVRLQLVGGYTAESVTHGQCDTSRMVTFLVTDHCHCPLAGTHFPSH